MDLQVKNRLYIDPPFTCRTKERPEIFPAGSVGHKKQNKQKKPNNPKTWKEPQLICRRMLSSSSNSSRQVLLSFTSRKEPCAFTQIDNRLPGLFSCARHWRVLKRHFKGGGGAGWGGWGDRRDVSKCLKCSSNFCLNEEWTASLCDGSLRLEGKMTGNRALLSQGIKGGSGGYRLE